MLPGDSRQFACGPSTISGSPSCLCCHRALLLLGARDASASSLLPADRVGEGCGLTSLSHPTGILSHQGGVRGLSLPHRHSLLGFDLGPRHSALQLRTSSRTLGLQESWQASPRRPTLALGTRSSHLFRLAAKLRKDAPTQWPF
ncbi:hypothetical protein NDU88_003460 [Pleurodeles waltl]|uniref:Uncharacterized protein n=1 Tax=Pleurodeles waltl TaxID=8319 RepID=A0AAV7UYH9_PLEWA|nr:hypothetical protein NDU88_003460 [Pleurodeles waltl]